MEDDLPLTVVNIMFIKFPELPVKYAFTVSIL